MTDIPELVYLQLDDWKALYVNGKLHDQGHSLNWGYTLEGIPGINFKSAWVEQWYEESDFGGKFPEELPDYVED